MNLKFLWYYYGDYDYFRDVDDGVDSDGNGLEGDCCFCNKRKKNNIKSAMEYNVAESSENRENEDSST